MTIDWMHFSPIPALIGGILIGVAAAILVLGNGRITGISGILGGLWLSPKTDRIWRIAFLLGMFAAPWVYGAFAPRPDVTIEASWLTIIVAGLLVGVGTLFASGCTSGHGVCGLSRGSPRSLVATLSFMAAGFVTVYVVRHLLGA